MSLNYLLIHQITLLKLIACQANSIINWKYILTDSVINIMVIQQIYLTMVIQQKTKLILW